MTSQKPSFGFSLSLSKGFFAAFSAAVLHGEFILSGFFERAAKNGSNVPKFYLGILSSGVTRSRLWTNCPF